MILTILYWAKEARHKQIHVIRSHLYEFQEQAKVIHPDRDHNSDNFGWVIGCQRARVSMLGAGTIPNLDLGGGYTQLHTFTKNHQAVCLRFMSFTTCKLYINWNVFKCCRIKEIGTWKKIKIDQRPIKHNCWLGSALQMSMKTEV